MYLISHYGNIYQHAGLTNFAEENYKKVLELSPDYSWAYFNLASIAYSNNNIDEAIRYLLKTIQLNDSDIEAYKLITKIFLKEDKIDEIITLLETRLDKEENGDLYYLLGRVYKYIGDGNEYVNSLREALSNQLTLTYDKEIVKQEYEHAGQILNSNGVFEPEEKIEDYAPEENKFEEEIENNEKNDDEDDEDDFDFEDDDIEEEDDEA